MCPTKKTPALKTRENWNKVSGLGQIKVDVSLSWGDFMMILYSLIPEMAAVPSIRARGGAGA